jgi:cysteine-rich repeat protein
MKLSRLRWMPFLVLSVLAGCDCSGDTGIPDAGGADVPPTIDTGPRVDAAMRCGNREVEGTEACDDGNRTADDGCAPDCTLECGDGRVGGDEICDTGLPTGMTGACPTGCDDGDLCTTDSLDGSDCGTTCSNAPITAPADDDMCCPTGATAATDNDCAGTCGDGILSGTEACDTAIAAGVGSCPTTCDDGIACTADVLAGGGTCDAACTSTPIVTPADGDGCCPTGATIGTDDDCAAACGDGVLSAGEGCDTGITSGVGSCPTSCDDGLACTTDTLIGAGTCGAICAAAPITTPINGDGCCPTGATMATDNDCSGRCGDGIVQSGENCDTAITSGAGRCPTTCNDGMACTTDTLTGAGTCSAGCMTVAITMPRNGDMCCPTGATIGTDNDCPARCGDRVVSAGETCDTGITAGAGACPTMCNDMMACTRDMLANGASCTAACMFTPITTPMAGDMCCPTGATVGTDTDCPVRCGDRVVSAPETCDDGNTTSGDGCSATCAAEVTRTAFRFTDLDIQDPHLWANVLGCQDVTNSVLGLIDGVNPLLQDNIRTDGDMPADGLLDLSITQIFSPLSQTAGAMPSTYVSFPDCTVPYTSTMCTLPLGGDRTAAVAATNAGGGAVCLGTLPMTTRYTFALPTAPTGGTCYSAAAGTISFDLGGIPVTLEDAYIGGEYFGSPATEIRDGLIRGFISYANADATIIPPGTTGQAAIDGQPLSRLLRTRSTTVAPIGACGSSMSASDLDVGPGGAPGWYFYLSFRASIPASYTEL